jgi:hypothetical protein
MVISLEPAIPFDRKFEAGSTIDCRDDGLITQPWVDHRISSDQVEAQI